MARSREYATPIGDHESYGWYTRFSHPNSSDNHDDYYGESVISPPIAHSETRPRNEWQALMECMPGQEPLPSVDELLPLREILSDAIDQLSERDQWIFDSLVVRRLSLRQLSSELSISKTHLARVRDEVFVKLRLLLQENPLISEYLQ